MASETIKILLLEDDKGEVDELTTTAERLGEEKNIQTDFIVFPSLTAEVYEKLVKEHFDFLVVDLSLSGDDADHFSWKDFIDIVFKKFHIPIIINSWNPDPNIPEENSLVKLFNRSNSAEEILNYIFNVYKTGITKVFWRNWPINSTLTDLIYRGELPDIQKWISDWTTIFNSEESLARYILSHLESRLSNNYKNFHTEEVYLKVKAEEIGNDQSIKLKTWRIIKQIGTDQLYVIINPACDIANGKFVNIICLHIDPLAEVFNDQDFIGNINDYLNNQSNNKKEKIEKYIKRKTGDFSIILPKTSLCEGGFINFKKIKSLDHSQISQTTPPLLLWYEAVCDIAPLFVKDIISKFSSYYARQWTPDYEDVFYFKSFLYFIKNRFINNCFMRIFNN